MEQSLKQLLLKDLSARLPYGVICQFIWTYSNETTDGESVIAKKDDNIKCINIHIEEIQADYYDEWVDLEHCKPYLRPMSSMTEEELKTFYKIEDMEHPVIWNIPQPNWHFSIDGIDWLLSKQFDFRGLIEKGLALEASEGMYN